MFFQYWTVVHTCFPTISNYCNSQCKRWLLTILRPGLHATHKYYRERQDNCSCIFGNCCIYVKRVTHDQLVWFYFKTVMESLHNITNTPLTVVPDQKLIVGHTALIQSQFSCNHFKFSPFIKTTSPPMLSALPILKSAPSTPERAFFALTNLNSEKLKIFGLIYIHEGWKVFFI